MNIDPALSVQQVVNALQLEAHVEGGYFRQTFKAPNEPAVHTQSGARVTMTSIYYLLTADSPVGHFHMNTSNIMHYFHGGDPITYYLLHADGTLEDVILGNDILAGHQLQLMVPSGIWKASTLPVNGAYGYGLIGEAVAPGFEYSDMTLGTTNTLAQLFPQHVKLVTELSRP